MIAHFNSLSKEAIERRGRKEGMEGRREVVNLDGGNSALVIVF